MLRFSEMFVEALQRRWRRNANLNELAALDAGGLADMRQATAAASSEQPITCLGRK